MKKEFDIEIPYLAYTMLDERSKFEIDFVINYSHLEEKDYFSEIELEDRNFGFVKSLMASFSNGDNEEVMKLLFTLPEYDEKVFSISPAWKVILTIQYIGNKIAELIKIENEMLSSQVQDNKYSGQIEQIDFSLFDTEYIQLRELANKDITKFDEIRSLPYARCLIELIYRQKEADLEKLIMKTTMK